MSKQTANMSSASSSALMGQRPNTIDDYYITIGLLRIAGKEGPDPNQGYTFAPQPPPNYVYETRVTEVIVGCIFVMLAIIIPTAFRLGLKARRASPLGFGWDDWTILLAALTALCYPIIHIILPLTGAAARHTWDMTYQQYNSASYGGFIALTVFYVAVGLIKLSIALFVRRMAESSSKRWRIFINIFLVTVVAYILLAIFWNVFSCNVVAARWDIGMRGRASDPPICMDTIPQGRILSYLHVAQGVILLTTPIFILWKVKIDKAKKVRLCVVWALGALAVAGGLLRELKPSTVTPDFSWDYTELLIWTCVDLTLGLLVASLPVLDGLLASRWHRASDQLVSSGFSAMAASRQKSHADNNTHQGKPWLASSKFKNNGSTITTNGLERTESREQIITQDDQIAEDLEMGQIIRTQEIEVRYHTKGANSDGPPTPRREHYLDRSEWRRDTTTQSEAPQSTLIRKISTKFKRPSPASNET